MGLFRKYIKYKCVIENDVLFLPVIVKNKKDEQLMLPFVVDTGAQCSFIRGDLIKHFQLDIERYKRKSGSYGVGGVTSNSMTCIVRGFAGTNYKEICFPASASPQCSDSWAESDIAGLIGYDLMRGGKIDLKRGILKIRIDNVINCSRSPYWLLGWAVSQRYGFAPVKKFGLIPEYELTEEEKAEMVEYNG